jgi:hypothetical protein
MAHHWEDEVYQTGTFSAPQEHLVASPDQKHTPRRECDEEHTGAYKLGQVTLPHGFATH